MVALAHHDNCTCLEKTSGTELFVISLQAVHLFLDVSPALRLSIFEQTLQKKKNVTTALCSSSSPMAHLRVMLCSPSTPFNHFFFSFFFLGVPVLGVALRRLSRRLRVWRVWPVYTKSISGLAPGTQRGQARNCQFSLAAQLFSRPFAERPCLPRQALSPIRQDGFNVASSASLQLFFFCQL